MPADAKEYKRGRNWLKGRLLPRCFLSAPAEAARGIRVFIHEIILPADDACMARYCLKMPLFVLYCCHIRYLTGKGGGV